MNETMLQAMYPHFDEAKIEKALAIFEAADPLKQAISKMDNKDHRAMLLQNWSQLVANAVQLS